MESDENILVSKLIKKDGDAFKMLFDTHKDKIYNTVLGFVQNAGDAEDITQEVFIEIFESVKGFRGGSKLSTWIYRISVTKSLDYLRAKKRKKRFAIFTSLFGEKQELIHDPPDFKHPGIKMENTELAAFLFKAMDLLPQNQKIAFTLNKIENLSYTEICEVMNISLSSVESLMHRAKSNLKKTLGEYYKS